jgi:hypothetical protein
MNPLRASRSLDVGAAVLIVLVTLTHAAYYFPRVVDDLFISLRYADNLAHGRGAVYNVGDRVEGFSGPAWMVLQALGIALGAEGVTWTKILGVTSLLGLVLSLFLLTRFVFGVRGLLAWIPSAACAANSYIVNWAVLGLETPFHLLTVVLSPVTVHRYLVGPSLRRAAFATCTLIALACARPESPMYLGLVLIAPVLNARSRADLRAIVRRLATVALPSLAVLLVLLLLRGVYYGRFVPNTYFAKAVGASFESSNLAALWEQGVGRVERVSLLGGSILLVILGWTRRVMAPALILFGCAFFTGSVVVDWMPSLRHLLPVAALSPVGWVVLADILRHQRQLLSRVAGIVPVAIVAGASLWIVRIENRFSPAEARGRGWVSRKTRAKWNDTILAYRRIEPPHVARMDNYNMGQITQAWAVLETSAGPIEDSWYAGRDIGAVGYFTSVRVFDTAGLFTTAVSQSEAWTHNHVVTYDLVHAMMALRPLAGEVYEGWETTLGRYPELLRGYRIRVGGPRSPVSWIAADRMLPARSEILRRYVAFAARFPRSFHLQTLYGETVGAAVEKRLRILRGR